jgi:hypothetical protein
MKTKILITIEGGVVQSVISNDQDVVIAIVDYDDNSDDNLDDPVMVQVGAPDMVLRNMADAFKPSDGYKLDKVERLARLKLHQAKFFENS